GIDWKEQASVSLRRVIVSEGVANHQGVVRRIHLGLDQQLLLGSLLLAANLADVAVDLMLAPFLLERLAGCGGANDQISLPLQLLQTLTDERKRRHVPHQFVDRPVYGL